jgi:CelD/BcsL family acetyltransferase involved in cellulose biosynthesis
MDVSVLHTHDELDAVLPEWTALYEASGSRNPFADPRWLTVWARHYAGGAALETIVVRDRGGLAGVAPFYRGGGRLERWRMLGSVDRRQLNELPQVVVRADCTRDALRAVFHELVRRGSDYDWIDFVLAPEQGWTQPEWFDLDGSSCFSVHRGTRPCVVLPLPGTWDALRAGLKRNVKESIRRSTNRLKRDGHTFELTDEYESVDALRTALAELRRLHAARAKIEGTIAHPDYFAGGANVDFLDDVAERTFGAGLVRPALLEVDGEVVAARLVLRGNGALFFSISGFDPAWWDYGPLTLLDAESLRTAIERGDTHANLSIGPDTSKLRWSERLELHQDFVLVGNRPRARRLFSAWAAASAAKAVGEGRRRARSRRAGT